MARTLYEEPSSPASRTVRWLLEWKGMPFVRIVLDDAVREELRPRLGDELYAPLLADGDSAVAGLRPVAFYLERVCPEPSLFPADPQKRNQAATFAEFAEEVLGRLLTALLPGASAGEEREKLLADLRARLGQVREAIARRALDGDAPHLGDLAVAAHVVTCQEVPELDFARENADLAAYVVRVRARAMRRQAS